MTGCGECWEHVIRADESRHAYQRSLDEGQCRVCGQPVEGHEQDLVEVAG
ncbi:hypothetical protein G7075_04435 [Phycicoccus sp. HDW14]|nr:hypothetical protein [Phycicoccus sp. HDW14]QIM20565.1 hypothetical protein G7075_04435 [Phycicoccus sp. HDW14]